MQIKLQFQTKINILNTLLHLTTAVKKVLKMFIFHNI